MSTEARTRRTGPRTVAFKAGMAPERVEAVGLSPEVLTARVAAYREAVPAVYRHLTVADLPARQTAAVIDWLNGGSRLLWLGGTSWRGKTATGWLLVARYAAETGKSWAFTSTAAYLAARRGIQSPAEQALIDRCHAVDVLILDEWPLTLNAGGDLTSLRELMDIRARRGRTVITANAAPGIGAGLTGHADPAVADAATALHNRIVHKHPDGAPGPATFYPYPEDLPRLTPIK